MVTLEISELDAGSRDTGTPRETGSNPEESLGIGSSLLFIPLLAAGTWGMFAATYWMVHEALT